MEIGMRCLTKPHKGQPYTLVHDNDVFSLVAEHGERVLSFPSEAIDGYAKFPSFSQSIKYFSLLVDTRWHQFKVDPKAIRSIRKVADLAMARRNPRLITSLRTNGWLFAIGGAVAIVAGPFVSWASYMASRGGGRYYIYYGISIAGLAALVRGSSILRRARALAAGTNP